MGSSADRSGASLALVIAVVGALGVVAGNWINAESHKGDIDAKLIELSVGICAQRRRRKRARCENGRLTSSRSVGISILVMLSERFF